MLDLRPSVLSGVKQIHLVGIGGIGMMALAQYLSHAGYVVTGSDLRDGPHLDGLRAAGITVREGHDPALVDRADLVVATSAAHSDNSELQEAGLRGVSVIKRAALLGAITDQGRTLAVAGTHGKTTTTAMIGHIMQKAGLRPTVFGGGLTRSLSGPPEGPGTPGDSDQFVVEADEYDRSFLNLHPAHAVITSLDFDHPDVYRSMDDMEEAYIAFAGQVSGAITAWGESPAVMHVMESTNNSIQTYGVDGSYTWTAADAQFAGGQSTFALSHEGSAVGDVTLTVPGLHNVRNALAAIASASAFADLDPSSIAGYLGSFHGIVRRLENRGVGRGVTVIDDYAHHPSEIEASISALRANFDRIIVIFQPHTYSRTQALMREFVSALESADVVILLDVYGAREQPSDGQGSDVLARGLRRVHADSIHATSNLEAVKFAVDAARPGDAVVTMGAGDVTGLVDDILTSLRTSV